MLAWPMMLARVGIVTMHTMDVIVLGRAGAGPLSDYVLGQAIQDYGMLEEGDRVEIYRPLLIDPKQARLRRAARRE